MEIFIRKETISSAIGRNHFSEMDKRAFARKTAPAGLDAAQIAVRTVARTAVKDGIPVVHAWVRQEPRERQGQPGPAAAPVSPRENC